MDSNDRSELVGRNMFVRWYKAHSATDSAFFERFSNFFRPFRTRSLTVRLDLGRQDSYS
jgi:hypothetical protein